MNESSSSFSCSLFIDRSGQRQSQSTYSRSPYLYIGMESGESEGTCKPRLQKWRLGWLGRTISWMGRQTTASENVGHPGIKRVSVRKFRAVGTRQLRDFSPIYGCYTPHTVRAHATLLTPMYFGRNERCDKIVLLMTKIRLWELLWLRCFEITRSVCFSSWCIECGFKISESWQPV